MQELNAKTSGLSHLEERVQEAKHLLEMGTPVGSLSGLTEPMVIRQLILSEGSELTGAKLRGKLMRVCQKRLRSLGRVRKAARDHHAVSNRTTHVSNQVHLPTDVSNSLPTHYESQL